MFPCVCQVRAYATKKKAALPGDADGQLPAPIRRRGKRLPIGDSHVSHVMLISRTDMHCVQD